MPTTGSEKKQRIPVGFGKFLLAAAVASALLIAGGVRYYTAQHDKIIQETKRDLGSIAAFKSDQIAAWMAEREANAEVVMGDPFLRAAIKAWMAEPTGKLRGPLNERLGRLAEYYQYSRIYLADATGQAVLSLPAGDESPSQELVELIGQAFRTRELVPIDLHPCAHGPHLGYVLPIFEDIPAGEPIGALVLLNDAKDYLYPTLQAWPLANKTFEVLLIRQEGDHVLFLNELRWYPDAAFKLRLPLSRTDLPASMAIARGKNEGEGTDYRGVRVLAGFRHIPNSPWFLVAKLDRSEALAQWRREAPLILTLLFTLVLGTVTLALVFWQRQTVNHQRRIVAAQEALNESERRFRTYFSESLVGMAISTPDKAWVQVNQALADMVGYSLDELYQKNWLDLTSPEDVNSSLAHFQDVLDGTTDSYRLEKQFVRKDGGTVHAILSVRAVRKEDGSVDYLLSQFQDITERRRQEETLKANEERFRGYFDASPIGMGIAGPDKLWQRVNPALCAMLGYGQEELMGRSWTELTHPEDLGEDERQFARMLAREVDGYRMEKRFLRKDGEVVSTILSVRGVHGADGRLLYAVKQIQDITVRKRQEEALRVSEEENRTTFEQAAVGIAYLAPDGHWLRANQRLCEILGRREEELAGTLYHDLTHPQDQGLEAAHLKALLAGETCSYRMEKRCLRQDDSPVWVLVSMSLVHDSHHEPRHLIAVVEDINARRRAEERLSRLNEELRRSNEELQQFAYVASHDLQEPLRMVSSYTQLIQEVYGEQLDEEAHKWIHYAVDGANRMQRLIEDLLSYSRVATRGREFERVDSHAALGQALANLQQTIQENDAMVTNSDLPEVTADPLQLVQLFQNLVGNAIKYRSEISPHVHVSAARKEHLWEFSVSDNGIGIDPKFQERVFVIFQRLHTRREYPGTGIGLAICRRIVERHGGTIWFESEPDHGTTFRFTLLANALRPKETSDV